MSSNLKSAVAHPEAGRTNLYRIAIVGAATLKGKEIAEVLSDRNFPSADIKLLDDAESLGQVLTPELQPRPVVIAHPAAVVLALLLLRVQKANAVKRVVATVFEPASEHGQKGMDELHEQTVNLLSFQQLPKKIFDTQVAFNMVTRYGEQSVPPLGTVEIRVLNHYRRIAGTEAPVPSLLMIQAPIFHGHAFAIHLELAASADLDALSQS